MKLLILILSLSFSWANADEYCGKLSSVKGQVDILKLKSLDKDVREAFPGENKMEFLCSDIIATGKASRVKLHFINNSVLSMGPNSRIEVAKYSLDKKSIDMLNLTYGKVRAIFKNNEAPSEKGASPVKGKRSAAFSIKTPTAVSGVRGTDFYLGFNPNTNVTDQATITGKVEVQDIVTKQTVIVEPGNQVTVEIKPPGITAKEVPPLEVKPLEKSLVNEIRETSSIVKDDPEFTSKEAVKILGDTKTWVAPEVPEKFQDIKEQF